ncbi:MAG: hypothetical protein EAX89_17025 [Candidatus Lokiarchaeota archaeon]|nr:hypothetical protein [Candidatus Lokiarchaeota archaeon]
MNHLKRVKYKLFYDITKKNKMWLMKNSKIKLMILFITISFLISIKPSFALNNYAVDPGANFRWDATKYFFMKDGLGLGNDLVYTHNYYLEFNFTNWAGVSGAEYLNGTINHNGTIFTGEISHAYYYSAQPFGQEWVTDIIDYQGTYPVHVYLVCNTEIEQTTKPNLQNLAANSWLTFAESPTYNFSLTGTYIEDTETDIYTGNIRFNSDKVLSYVFDEMVQKDSGITVYIERYIWTLTYTPGTPTDGLAIPGFQIWALLSVIFLGVLLIYKKIYPISRKR